MTRCRERRAAVFAVLALLAIRLPAQEPPDYHAPEALWSFALALYNEGDYSRAAGEFLRYQFVAVDGAHRLEASFRAVKCRQLSGDLEMALAGFRQLAMAGSDESWAVRARYETAISAALLGRNEEALFVLSDPALPVLTPAYDPGLLRGWCLLLRDDWTGAEAAIADSASQLAPRLAAIAEAGRSLPRRSPAFAGLLSALLPGAGKLYAGRVADGLFSLGLIGSLAVLSGLGFAENGVKSVRGWAYGSVGLLFHVGNIYGAVVAARQFNRNGEVSLESRARDFYAAHLR